MKPPMLLRTTAAAALAVAFSLSASLAAASPAWAGGIHGGPGSHGGGGGGGGGGSSSTLTTGIDVSYPQCGDSLPAGEAFVIVGVNGGVANDYNSCLASEFAYAQTSTGVTKEVPAQTYLNTGDPGNTVADWPSPGQLGAYGSTSTPSGTCDYAIGTSGAGADSLGCAYIYGYDMVRGISYATSTTSGNIAGDVSDFNSATGQALYSFPTWLDVETANSWQTGSAGLAMNVADLQGMVDAIHAAAGAATPAIGVYSTSYQWGQITGTPGSSGNNLYGLPDWIPGARGQSGAASNCKLAPFTGGSGGVPVTQWFGHPYDGDYSCFG